MNMINETAGITPVSVYQWEDILSMQAPTPKLHKPYTLGMWACIVVFLVSISTIFATVYDNYQNHLADVARVEAITVLDNEYCGESLLGKVLPHDETRGLTQKLLDQYFSGITYEELTKEDIIYPGNPTMSYDTIYRYQNTTIGKYQYVSKGMNFSTRRTGDGPIGFVVYSTEDSLNDYNTACRQIYDILAELNINGSVTKKEAIIRINEWICDNRYYEMDPYKREWSTLHSVQGDSGVCYNYTVLFQMLCLGAGIECEYIVSDNGAHCWNKVYSNDGSYWFVDVCWNDGSVTGITGDPIDENKTLAFDWFGSGRYDYLLETEAEFHASHAEYFQ